MTITKNYIYAFVLGAILFAGLSVYAQTRDVTSYRGDSVEQYDHYTLIDASVETATSSAIEIAHAEKVQVYFTRNDGDGTSGTGTSTFSIEISPDGTNFYDFNKLISNVTNTNSQELTRVGSVQLATATSTTMVALDIAHDAFHSIRCIANNQATTSVSSATCEVSVRE